MWGRGANARIKLFHRATSDTRVFPTGCRRRETADTRKRDVFTFIELTFTSRKLFLRPGPEHVSLVLIPRAHAHKNTHTHTHTLRPRSPDRDNTVGCSSVLTRSRTHVLRRRRCERVGRRACVCSSGQLKTTVSREPRHGAAPVTSGRERARPFRINT